MQNIKKSLAEKGWSKKDISRAVKIIEKAKENKHPKIKILDKSVYWISLLLAILGNFIISVSLIPVLLVLKNFQLYAVIITMGVSFGLLFELLIRTIELKTHHHIFLSILMPLVALINIMIIGVISNNLEKIISLQNQQNPFFVGIAYALSFMLPYFAYQLLSKNKL